MNELQMNDLMAVISSVISVVGFGAVANFVITTIYINVLKIPIKVTITGHEAMIGALALVLGIVGYLRSWKYLNKYDR